MTESPRVAGLLSELSLPRKAAQMVQAERLHISPEEVRRFGVGSILSGAGSLPGDNSPADWVDMNDEYWAASTEARPDGSAGIPALYAVDAVHGHNNVAGATIFPQNIGLGAANDPPLVERIARVTAREVLATGLDWTFAPTLAVARDCRWGRTYESFSAAPEVVAAYAAPMVRGLQGEVGSGGRIGPDGILACAKHWAGDGGTTDGVDQGDTVADEAEFLRAHALPYREAIRAGTLTVMVSLSSWNGTLCHAHHRLVTELLKGELGFGGIVVSDWNGIMGVADDFGEAVAKCVNAGIDMFMVPEEWEKFIGEVVRQVERGAIGAERVDDAVRRILMVKESYGLFDRPRPSARPWSNHASFGSAEHRDVAREAVRKSLVLLKNEGGLLPLDRTDRILVAGRNADDRGSQCGGFTIEWQGVRGNERIEGGASIWEGVRALAPCARLLRADGAAADATDADGDGFIDHVFIGEANEAGPSGGDEPPFAAAIVVIGEKPYAEGMGDIRPPSVEPVRRTAAALTTYPRADDGPPLPGPGVMEPYGSTLRLSELHPEDLETIRAVAARNIPVVAALISGRPLVVADEIEASTAFVAAWLPGSEGRGVAETLFGDCDFQGRLTHAWPTGENADGAPEGTLFPVGYGLSAAAKESPDQEPESPDQEALLLPTP